MSLKPVPIFGGSYSDDSRPYDQQERTNYLPEVAENPNARSQGILRGVPGLVKVLTLGGTGQGRGIRNVEGKLFVVQGHNLYEISTSFVPTNRGTVTGSGQVSMGHNQINNGNQLTIVNGPEGFVWDTASETFTQITDDAFVGSSVTGYIDQYMVHLEPLGRFWYISDIADALSFNASNRFSAESNPDIIKSLIVTHEEVWALGAKSIEQFVDTAGNDGTSSLFTRQNGTIMQQGMAGARGALALDNTVFWLGDDGIFYKAAGGYIPQRISTFGVEQQIRDKDWSQVFAMGWTDNGHKVAYWTFPDGYTWGYDVSNNLWHRRNSYGLDVWRVNNLAYWNGDWYGTDFTNGNLYRLDWSVYKEDTAPLVSVCRTAYAHDSEERLFLTAIQLYMDTGRGPVDPDSYVNLRYSDDGGFTWSNWRQFSLNASNNERSRIMFRRLGQFRDRVFEIMVSANVRRDIIDAYIQIGAGS